MKKENEEKIKEAKDAIEKAKKKQGKFFKEFKEFALRGNVLDLAVGVLIGSAFQSVVTSFTNNIISPILGCFGGVNFSEWVLEIGKLKLTYGAFLTDIINFLINGYENQGGELEKAAGDAVFFHALHQRVHVWRRLCHRDPDETAVRR